MSPSDQHVTNCIRYWVWSGFHTPLDVKTMIDDVLDEDCDEAQLRAAIPAEFARKREAEKNWPTITDCDRLDRVFYHLHEQGICALHNAGYTMSDGYSDVAEAVAQAPADHYHAYCFYHGQDVERAVDGEGLMIAFGDLDDRQAEGLAVGRAVTEALADAGFEVLWNQSFETRLSIPKLDWRRRGPPNILDSGPIQASAPRLSTSAPQPPAPRRPWWKFW